MSEFTKPYEGTPEKDQIDPILRVVDETAIDAAEAQLLRELSFTPAYTTNEILLSRVLAGEVSLPNGIAGKIEDLLSNDSTSVAAVEGATQAHIEYQDALSLISGITAGKELVASKTPENVAKLGVLRRVKDGRFNGQGNDIEMRAKWQVGTFISSAGELHRNFVSRTEGVVFDAKRT